MRVLLSVILVYVQFISFGVSETVKDDEWAPMLTISVVSLLVVFCMLLITVWRQTLLLDAIVTGSYFFASVETVLLLTLSQFLSLSSLPHDRHIKKKKRILSRHQGESALLDQRTDQTY